MAGDIRIVIDADAGAVVREVGKAKRSLATLSDGMSKAAREAKVYQDATGRWREENGRFVASARKAELGLDRVAAQSGRARAAGDAFSAAGAKQVDTLQGIGRAARTAVTGLSVLGAAGMLKATKDGLRFNATMESNRIALDQLTGSSEAAEQLLADLFQTAKETPFEFAQITDAAKKFLAFGFTVKDTKTALDATGDAVAALGGGAEKIDRVTIALGQIKAKGRVQGDELLQLAEAGIPAYQILAEKLNLSADEVKNIGKAGIEADVAIKALTDGMSERFGGMTERQAKSFDGMMSTLRDNYAQTMGAMTDGLFQEMTKWLPAINSTSEQITAIWQKDKLSFAEKFDASRGVVDRELGPMFDQIEAKLAEVDFGQAFADALNAALPLMVDAAGEMGVEAAKAVANAFVTSDALGKAILAGFILKKAGVFAAWRTYGQRAGKAAGAGIAAGTAAGAAAGAAGGAAGGGGAGRLLNTAVGKAGVIGGAAYGLSRPGSSESFNLPQQTPAAQLAGLPGLKQLTDIGEFFAGPFKGDNARSTEELRKFGETAEESFRKFERLGDVRGLASLSQQARGLAREFPESRKELEAFANAVGRQRSALQGGLKLDARNILSQTDLRQVIERFRDMRTGGANSVRELTDRVDLGMAGIRKATRSGTDDSRRLIIENFGAGIDGLRTSMAKGTISTDEGMKAIRSLTRRNMDFARLNMSDLSRDGRVALARNMESAANAVGTQMARAGGATREGMAEIRRLMRSALKLYGFSEEEAAKLAKAGVSVSDVKGGKDLTKALGRGPQGLPGGKAAGGYIGRPGQAGPDDVPAMLGRGEAVLNRHQQQPVEHALKNTYGMGLRELFAQQKRPHYAAQGGFVQGASAQGLTGPAKSFAGQMFQRGFNVTSAYRGDSGTFHGKGAALDFGDSVNDMAALGRVLKPMRGQLAELFGPGGSWKFGRPIGQVPGHMDHWHAAVLKAVAGGAGGGGGGAVAAQIKRIRVRGDLGVVSTIAQGAVDSMRAAANQRLDAAMMASDVGGHGAAQAAGGKGSGDVISDFRRAIRMTGATPVEKLALWEAGIVESGLRNLNYGDRDSIGSLQERGHYGSVARRMDSYQAAMRFLGEARALRPWRGSAGALAQAVQRSAFPARYDAVAGQARQYLARGGFVGADAFAGAQAAMFATGGMAFPKGGSKSKDKVKVTDKKKPAKAKTKGYKPKPMRYRGKVAQAVPQLTRITDLDGTLEQLGFDEGILDRTHGLTDEQATRTLPVGQVPDQTLQAAGLSPEQIANLRSDPTREVEVRDEAGIAGRVGEIDQTLGLKGRVGDTLKAQMLASQEAVRRIMDAIRERQQRIKEILKQAQRNKKEISAAQDQEEGTRTSIKRERKRKKPDKRKLEQLRDRRERLLGRLDRLRDERESLIGTRSIKAEDEAPRDENSYLGRTRAGLTAYQEALPAPAEKVSPEIPRARQTLGLDIAELHKERSSWLETAMPAIDPELLRNQGEEQRQSEIASLLREQLQAERESNRLMSTQFGVFTDFGALVQARTVGTFLHGGRIPETGLAFVHKSETVIPAPDGPFQMTARDMMGGGQAAAPVIQLTFTGNSGQLVSLIDSRVNGRAAHVTSRDLGRRSRLFGVAPGR